MPSVQLASAALDNSVLPNMTPHFGGFTSCDLELRPLQLKIGTPRTLAAENVYDNFDFFYLCFRVTSPHGTDRRTDRRTGKTRNAAYRTAA